MVYVINPNNISPIIIDHESYYEKDLIDNLPISL